MKPHAKNFLVRWLPGFWVLDQIEEATPGPMEKRIIQQTADRLIMRLLNSRG